jgi:hypothetical protein
VTVDGKGGRFSATSTATRVGQNPRKVLTLAVGGKSNGAQKAVRSKPMEGSRPESERSAIDGEKHGKEDDEQIDGSTCWPKCPDHETTEGLLERLQQFCVGLKVQRLGNVA